VNNLQLEQTIINYFLKNGSEKTKEVFRSIANSNNVLRDTILDVVSKSNIMQSNFNTDDPLNKFHRHNLDDKFKKCDIDQVVTHFNNDTTVVAFIENKKYTINNFSEEKLNKFSNLMNKRYGKFNVPLFILYWDIKSTKEDFWIFAINDLAKEKIKGFFKQNKKGYLFDNGDRQFYIDFHSIIRNYK